MAVMSLRRSRTVASAHKRRVNRVGACVFFFFIIFRRCVSLGTVAPLRHPPAAEEALLTSRNKQPGALNIIFF